MPTKLILVDPTSLSRQQETLPTCACLMCRVASNCSARFFPNGSNPWLPRMNEIPTKGCSPRPPWRNVIRITSAFIPWIITCPEKLCADITETFLVKNSPTQSSSMPRRHVSRHGFTRASSITCPDALLFCSGKIEDPACRSNRSRCYRLSDGRIVDLVSTHGIGYRSRTRLQLALH